MVGEVFGRDVRSSWSREESKGGGGREKQKKRRREEEGRGRSLLSGRNFAAQVGNFLVRSGCPPLSGVRDG